jgi:integrase
MRSKPLTDTAVKNARTPAGTSRLLSDGGNLYLQITAKNDALYRAWVFRYARNGRDRKMGLGPYPDVSLAEAREKAKKCRQQLLSNTDPIEAKEVEARKAPVMTFDECAAAYIAAQEPTWKNPKHAAQWPSTLKLYVSPVFGHLPVDQIDVGLVLKALEPIWSRVPETAVRVRGRIEAILDYAAARELRPDNNPARWKGKLSKILPPREKVRAREHHSALPYSELPAFMVELAGLKDGAARALEFAILTATRTNETLGAKWSEIDGALWTIPAARMKSKREHRVPLTDAALAVLASVRRGGDLIFPGRKRDKPLSDMSMLMLLRRLRPGLTTHGFRSTFRTWAGEQTAFSREVAEAVLAHIVGDRTEQAYQRGDLLEKRRLLMEAWAKFCVSAVSN